MSDQIRFAPNVTQQLALADTSAMLEEHHGWDMWCYELTDGRMLVVSPEVASKINGLDLRPGEPFVIVKRWNGERRQKARWDVWRAGEAEQQRAVEEKSELEQQLRQSINQANARKREYAPGPPPVPLPMPVPAPASIQKPIPSPMPPEPLQPAATTPQAPAPASVRPIRHRSPDTRQLSLPWEERLRDESKVLTDVFAETLEYSSEKHGNTVKPEDIRSIVITAFISESQRGNRGG